MGYFLLHDFRMHVSLLNLVNHAIFSADVAVATIKKWVQAVHFTFFLKCTLKRYIL